MKRKSCSRLLVIFSCCAATALAATVVVAASSCGDGVCSVFEREAGDCQKDCAGFRGWCGNGKCELNENCRTCGLDCGFCGTATTEAEKQEEIPAVLCGDDVCSPEEGCGTCAKDCGACPGTWMGKVQYAFRRALRLARLYAAKGLLIGKQFTKVREALDFVDQQGKLLHKDALRRTEAAQELLLFLEQHDTLRRNMSAIDTSILDSVAGQGEQAGVLNFLPSLRIRSSARAALQQEEKDLQTAIKGMANDEGIVKLPKAPRSIEVLTEKMQRYQRFFPSEEATKIGWFAGTALAQDDAKKSLSSTDAFLESVKLLKEMRVRAAGADSAEPTIEENLAYLESRKILIAGILGKTEKKFNDDVTTMRVAVKKKEASSVLDAANVARFIRTSENFRTSEETFNQISQGMRSWVSRFFFWEEPRASAQEILSTTLSPEALQKFQDVDFDAKREVLREVFQRKGEEKTSSLLAKLPEAERIIFQERFLSLQTALNEAASVSDLQDVLANWRVLMKDIQRATVRQQNFLLRFIFPVSSFFF